MLDQRPAAPQPGPVGGATRHHAAPGRSSPAATVAGTTGINVFCYQVTPNHAWNLTDLPTRRTDGSLVQRPVAAVDLHYLISCYGDEPALEPQRLLAASSCALAGDAGADPRRGHRRDRRSTTTTTETSLPRRSRTSPTRSSWSSSRPTPLSLEEMSRLWGVLDTPYLLSLTYLATVVLLAADVTPTRRAAGACSASLERDRVPARRGSRAWRRTRRRGRRAGHAIVLTRQPGSLGAGHDGPDRPGDARARRRRRRRQSVRAVLDDRCRPACTRVQVRAPVGRRARPARRRRGWSPTLERAARCSSGRR